MREAGKLRALAQELDEVVAAAEREDAGMKKEVGKIVPPAFDFGNLVSLCTGAQADGVSIRAALPDAAFENGRIARGWGYLWDAFDVRYTDAGTGRAEHEDGLLGDIGRNEMTRRAEFFCSQVALQVLRGEGLVRKLTSARWCFSEKGMGIPSYKKLSAAQKRRIAKMLESGETFFYSKKVGGMRLIDFLHKMELEAAFGAPAAQLELFDHNYPSLPRNK